MNEDGRLAATRGSQNLGQLLDGGFLDVMWSHVDFCDANNHRHRQSQCDAKVLFGHSDQASIGTDHQDDKVGQAASHAEQSCFEVVLVSSQVLDGIRLALLRLRQDLDTHDERDHFGSFLTDLLPRKLSAPLLF